MRLSCINWARGDWSVEPGLCLLVPLQCGNRGRRPSGSHLQKVSNVDFQCYFQMRLSGQVLPFHVCVCVFLFLSLLLHFFFVVVDTVKAVNLLNVSL